MPVHDWQFWVVSALALCGALYVLRTVLPERWNFMRRGRPGVKTTLTIAGKTVDRRK